MGSIDWRVHAGYLALNVHVGLGGASHLFKKTDKGWEAIACLRMVIE